MLLSLTANILSSSTFKNPVNLNLLPDLFLLRGIIISFKSSNLRKISKMSLSTQSIWKLWEVKKSNLFRFLLVFQNGMNAAFCCSCCYIPTFSSPPCVPLKITSYIFYWWPRILLGKKVNKMVIYRIDKYFLLFLL